jgi:c-di-GMP-binding flagellar brake protein YcgR
MTKIDHERPDGDFRMKKRKEKRFRQWNKAMIRAAETGRDTFDPEGTNAYTYDLSLGGARIHAEREFPAGTIVQVQIQLSRTGQFVSIESEVKWVKNSEAENVYEMGVEFLHRIPQTLMSLMKNLYDEGSRIPTTVDQRTGLAGTA